ncbi:cytochrome-c peroxidase [Noviherbaspirillum soli]|uniref:cytochrome-c peroxidase n=1 Tax=Noviherbaspirillum soli TaxID=1064518 RepID=UPI00188B3066|nr:cytochrome c peroxidase [Noviherbaspirillum soli]
MRSIAPFHSQARATPSALRALALALVASLAACGGGGASDSASVTGTQNASVQTASIQLSQVALLGQKIFSDASLSASGRQSCASCHDPASAHAAPNDLAVQLGGPDLTTQGFRAVPSLRYLNSTPSFFFADDGTPTGGFNHDGRARTLAEQGQRPFLAPHEMANASKADVVGKVRQAAYAEELRAAFGAAIFDDADAAFDRITFALQQFQKEDPAFHPFSSKYDRFLAGKAQPSDAEMRGLALFNNPAKGNCAACHPSAKSADGAFPLFTDFSYDSLGVPRNAAIAATADPTYFDMGLCGPDRTDLTAHQDLCGAFKVPTLRNVATRKTFFHNGAFTTLRDVLRFYVRRDTNPEEWYPVAADGTADKFNDLPVALRGNVNTSEAPYNRKPGMAPALSDAEIDDLLRFLGTLNDDDHS